MDCSIVKVGQQLFDLGAQGFYMQHFPSFTWNGIKLYFGWLFFQAFLYTFLPGKIGFGQTTPGIVVSL
jgi:7-dehydrocholesterol reductase